MPRLRARLLVLAVVVVAVYAALVAVAGARPLAEALASLRAPGLLLALAASAAAYSVRSLRWGVYLRRLGALAPAGPVGRASAFAMGLPQGKWGVGVKAWALRTRADVPYGRLVPAVLAERVSDVGGALLFLAVGLLVAPAPDLRLLAVLAAFAAALLVLGRSETVARLVAASLRWVPAVRRHEAAFLAAHRTLRGELHLRELAGPTALALVAFLLEGAILWALANAGLGLALSWRAAVLAAAVTDAAGMVALVPGGLVAAEASLVVMLTLLGVPLAEAAALTILYRAVALWFGVGLGVLGTAWLRFAAPRAQPVR